MKKRNLVLDAFWEFGLIERDLGFFFREFIILLIYDLRFLFRDC